MKTVLASTVAAALIMVSGVSSAPKAHAASAVPLDLDPVQAAQVARQRIKQRGPNRLNALDDPGSGDSADCGSVNIGNSQDTSARGRVNPREQNVIVVGPIFNTANCR